jgi:hypothetical protein
LSSKKCIPKEKYMAKQHYVNNKQFYEAILEYKKQCEDAAQKGLDEPRISNYIGECIYKIAEKLSTKPCFIGYSFRDEMISDGVENCILYFKDYNPNIGSNPFAYFTQVIYYAFIRRISKEEKHRYTLYKNFQEVLLSNHDTSLLVDTEDKNVLPKQLYDNINVFMAKYEKKETDKKEKRKQVKQGLQKFYEE